MVAEIPLNAGLVALVDDEDVQTIGVHTWTAVSKRKTEIVYAYRWLSRKPRISIRMHQQILGVLDGGLHIDHRDGNGLNNCRSNLRVVTASQNYTNAKKRRGDATSIYKGVSQGRGASWRVLFRRAGTVVHLGTFDSETEAARAFDRAAREHHGEFGTYNFPLPGERSALTGLIEPLSTA